MIPQQIAIVPYQCAIDQHLLEAVAAAIQKQVNRDLAAYWAGISVSVSAFADVGALPVGYWPIFIAPDIKEDALGLHLDDKSNQPFSLVKYDDGWSVTVSHECMEMIIDPYGNRLVPGNIPDSPNLVLPPAYQNRRVQFLVEVCDPSEAFWYTVDGIAVSDFYTPRFFDPIANSAVVYSHSGKILSPRSVLEGGYLSWHDPADGRVYQWNWTQGSSKFIDVATGNEITNEIVSREELEFGKCLRRFVDARTSRGFAVMAPKSGPDSRVITRSNIMNSAEVTAKNRIRQIEQLIRSSS
jgi:hypothetical protein